MPHRKNYAQRMYRYNRLTQAPSRFNGMRANKNSHPNDFVHNSGRNRGGHTKPVTFKNVDDTGIKDPSRRRHMHTKELHRLRREEAAG